MLNPRYLAVVAGLALATLIAGCTQGPRGYAGQRPPTDQLDPRDRGLQSKDVIDATDTLAMRMMALPELNQPVRRTVVVTNVENQTTNPRFNYDIFIQRLRANIGEQGRDRVALIARRGQADRLRAQELDMPMDPYGQGGGAMPGAAGGSMQPEFALHGTVSELRGRGTSYYLFDFTLTNLQTREEIPMKWETRVAN
jgi:hypothetical protein